MKTLKISIALIVATFFSINSFACKTCGCSAKKNNHSHSENSILKDINEEKSYVKWLAKKVTGSHEGYVSIKDAHLHFENDLLSGGTIIIDMQTINCTDLEGEAKENLETHLFSNDFFGVKKFPTASLEILKAKKIKKNSNKYNISATIEIKEIKKNIEFIAVLENGKATAELVLDRTKFDVRYGSGSFFENLGDNLIYDDFNLSVVIAY